LYAVHGRLELLRVADAVEPHEPAVPRKRDSSKLVVLLGQRWTPKSSRRRNHGRELECMLPPATGSCAKRRSQKAVMTVFNHVRGDHGPLAAILWSGLLALPEPCFGDVDCRVRKPVLIDQDAFRSCCCTKSSLRGEPGSSRDWNRLPEQSRGGRRSTSSGKEDSRGTRARLLPRTLGPTRL
jgi:hypothetical protein